MTTTETLITAYTAPVGTGERIWIVGDTLTFKATAETTGGALTAIECEAAPGGGPPPHVHEHEDESFYVLDGDFEFLLGETLVRAGRGDYVFVPRGTVHRFANVGDDAGQLLILFTPGGLERFFRVAGTPATHDGAAPPADTAEVHRTDAAAAGHGLRIIG